MVCSPHVVHLIYAYFLIACLSISINNAKVYIHNSKDEKYVMNVNEDSWDVSEMNH